MLNLNFKTLSEGHDFVRDKILPAVMQTEYLCDSINIALPQTARVRYIQILAIQLKVELL